MIFAMNVPSAKRYLSSGENLFEKHIRYAHEVYEKMKENKLCLLRPLQTGVSRLHTPGIENAKSLSHKKRSQSSCLPLPGKKRMAKSPSWATKENEHTATQQRQRNEDLAPLSPNTAQVCDNIIASAVTTAKQDLFPGKAVTYSPLNLDGTRPESNRVLSDTADKRPKEEYLTENKKTSGNSN